MRAVLMILFLLVTNPVYADWQYTKWGMTPEEVIKASRGGLQLVQNSKERNVLVKGYHRTGDYSFVIEFTFSEKRELEKIFLRSTGNDGNADDELKQSLIKIYGIPSQHESYGYPLRIETMVWKSDKYGMVITLNTKDLKPSEITYEPWYSKGPPRL